MAFKLSFQLLSIIVYKSQEHSTIKRTLNIALLVEINASFSLNTEVKKLLVKKRKGEKGRLKEGLGANYSVSKSRAYFEGLWQK